MPLLMACFLPPGIGWQASRTPTIAVPAPLLDAGHFTVLTTPALCRMLFDMDVVAQAICSDHSSASFKASIECFPGIQRILCWPHIYRELTKQQGRLVNKGYLDFIRRACEVSWPGPARPAAQPRTSESRTHVSRSISGPNVRIRERHC